MEANRLTEYFSRHWVCFMVRRGVDGATACNPNHRHQDWKCGWRWEASIAEEVWERLTEKQ